LSDPHLDRRSFGHCLCRGAVRDVERMGNWRPPVQISRKATVRRGRHAEMSASSNCNRASCGRNRPYTACYHARYRAPPAAPPHPMGAGAKRNRTPWPEAPRLRGESIPFHVNFHEDFHPLPLRALVPLPHSCYQRLSLPLQDIQPPACPHGVRFRRTHFLKNGAPPPRPGFARARSTPRLKCASIESDRRGAPGGNSRRLSGIPRCARATPMLIGSLAE